MKILALAIRLVMVAGFLIFSLGMAEELCLTRVNEISDYPSASETGFSPSRSIDADEQRGNRVAMVDITASYSPPINLNEQWALSQINTSGLWQITSGNPEIIVAILDTGIDRNHEELKNRVVAEVNFTDSPTPHDNNGHGTHIAGILVSSGNNITGIAGLAPEIRLMNVKVVDDTGNCQVAVVAKGIVWAVDNGASVINISLEFAQPSSELEEAINYAWRRGAVVIAAAGNSGSTQPAYPAYYENSIAVAATGQDDALAPLSNYGAWVDVAAPGFNVYSTLPENSYGYKSGTSFAAAYVSRLAALLLDIVSDTNDNGRLNDEIRKLLEAGCRETETGGMGKGIVDAAGSLAQVSYSAQSLP